MHRSTFVGMPHCLFNFAIVPIEFQLHLNVPKSSNVIAINIYLVMAHNPQEKASGGGCQDGQGLCGQGHFVPAKEGGSLPSITPSSPCPSEPWFPWHPLYWQGRWGPVPRGVYLL